MSDIVERLRNREGVGACLSGNHKFASLVMREAADEIERLTERCEAYKGQVEAGAAEIERLRKTAEAVCWFDWSDNDDDAVAAIDNLRRLLLPLPKQVRHDRS